MKVMFLFLSLFLCFSACKTSSEPSRDRYERYTIVFSEIVDNNMQIFSIKSDGSDRKMLTNGSSWSNNPLYSPDGEKIAFISDRDGAKDLWIMNSDGSGVLKLTTGEGTAMLPQFTPDGGAVIFRYIFTGQQDGLYRVQATGMNLEYISNTTYNDWNHRISPLGDKIVFQLAFGDLMWDIFILDLSDRSRLELTDGMSEWHPKFSPDGTKILYRSYSRDDFVMMNIDGSDKTNVTNHPSPGADGEFSHDGSRIAFSSFRDEGTEIYTMNIDGSDVIRLTNNQYTDRYPLYSPDDKVICYWRDEGEFSNIYLVSSDGTKEVGLSNSNKFNSTDFCISPTIEMKP